MSVIERAIKVQGKQTICNNPRYSPIIERDCADYGMCSVARSVRLIPVKASSDRTTAAVTLPPALATVRISVAQNITFNGGSLNALGDASLVSGQGITLSSVTAQASQDIERHDYSRRAARPVERLRLEAAGKRVERSTPLLP